MSQTETQQRKSRYVTVFEQLKDTDATDEGERLVSHGRELDDRYKIDEEREDFVPIARPIAVIDIGAEITDDELGDWCNSHAGKAVLEQYFPGIEREDPTLPDAKEEQ